MVGIILACAGPGVARDKKGAAPFGIVSGTVFRDAGFAFPGVHVTLAGEPEQPGSRVPRPQKAVTDARGEFAFRVPAAPMRFRITASAKGFETQDKLVTIQGEQRSDVTLTLVASSNK